MSTAPLILVVEDQASEREALVRVLRREDFQVVSADSALASQQFVGGGVDLVVSDLRLGDGSGMELLRYWKEHQPRTPFMMLAVLPDVETAVAAMKQGADDYLIKPVHSDELLMRIRRCLESLRKDATIAQLQQRLDRRFGIPNGTTLDDLEKEAVDQALRSHDGNRTHAARALGISVRTLQRKLKAWDLEHSSKPR